MNKHKYAGFTLLEAMIVVAIAGIIAALAMSSFQKLIERNRLKQVAETLSSDLQFARTESIKHSENVIVSRTAGTSGSWCYGLARKNPSTKTSCDCTVTDNTNAAYCDIKIVSGANFGNADMDTASGGNNTFDFRRGTIGPNGVTFSTVNYAARVVYSAVGRVRICSPNPMPTGKVGLPTNPTCT